MNDPPQPSRPDGGKGREFLAAIAFLVVAGLPVLFVFSFGLSPCKDGPCDPDGAYDLKIAAAVILVLAALVGLAAWRLAARRSARRTASEGEGGGFGLAVGALLALAAVAAYAFLIA